MTPAVHFFALLFLASSVASINQHQLELKQHYEYLASLAAFSCSKPQPRVFSVNKLLGETLSYGKAFFPDIAVLHRCDKCSGVCPSGHKCAPKAVEKIIRPFKATLLQETDHHKKGSWVIEQHELIEHLACTCVPLQASSLSYGGYSGSYGSSIGSSSSSSIGSSYGNSIGSSSSSSIGSSYGNSIGSSSGSSIGSSYGSSSGSSSGSSIGSSYGGSSGSSYGGSSGTGYGK